MEKFKSICPFCKNEFKAQEEWIGQKVICPQCNKEFIIEKKSSFMIKCHKCGQEIQVYDEWIGATVECPSCSNNIQINNKTDEYNLHKKNIANILSLIISIVALCLSIFSFINSCSAICSNGRKTKITNIAKKFNWRQQQIFELSQDDINFCKRQPSVVTLSSNMSKEPVKLMLCISLSDHYNYGYFGRKSSYYSIWCGYFNTENYNVEGWGYGYIRRDSSEGKFLFENLKDGKGHVAILSICYDENSQSSGEYFKICKVHEIR